MFRKIPEGPPHSRQSVEYNDCMPTLQPIFPLDVYPVPVIYMTTFVRFALATLNGKRAMINRRQELERARREGKENKPFPPALHGRYTSLWWLINRTYIATKDLDVFRDALPVLLREQSEDDWRRNIKQAGEAFIRFCSDFQGVPYRAATGVVEREGLTIIVNPEMFVQTSDGAKHVIKLCFARNELPSKAKEIISYLMNAAKREQNWPSQWQMSILHVQSGDLLPALNTTAAIAELVSAEAQTYVEMWRS